MTEDQSQGGFQRQLYDVDEKCGKCGAAITQLPFKPDPARREQLRCRDCYRSRQSFGENNR